MKNFCFKILFFAAIFMLPTVGAFAQKDVPADSAKFSLEDTLKDYNVADTVIRREDDPNLLLTGDTLEFKKKKKKLKKKLFYKLKTRRAYTKFGFGNRETVELFFTLKKYKEPDPYAQEIWWLDTRTQQLRNTKKIEKQFAQIPHGPYKKMMGGQVIEEGIFYIGTKHGRWVKYDQDFILLEKTKYFKGFRKESEITYYDREKTKPREIIPVVDGVKQGDYILFSEDGSLLEKGQFDNDAKVGIWTEYFPKSNRRKKITQYPETAGDTTFVPFVIKEWDERGRISYDIEEVKKQKLIEEKKRKEQLEIERRLRGE